MKSSDLVLIPLLALGVSCIPGTGSPGTSAESVSGVIEYLSLIHI